MKHRKCVYTSHYLYSKLNKTFFIVDLCCHCMEKPPHKKQQWTDAEDSSVSPGLCVYINCVAAEDLGYSPHYLILIVPLMEGSRSLTDFCQNHKTSSLQQWLHVHVHINLEGSFIKKLKQIFSLCHLHKLTVFVQFSLWMNSELTFKSFFLVLRCSWSSRSSAFSFHVAVQVHQFTPPQENSCLLTLFALHHV